MYKLLLSWRYLKTRFIALASIVSVTLGVATLIVVNSVMAGFVEEMQGRLHGILSDVELDAGFEQIELPEVRVEEIREIVGDDVLAISHIVRVPALMNFEFRGRQWTQQVLLMGIDEASYGDVAEFHPYMMNEENRNVVSFDLKSSGFDERLGEAGWVYRKNKFEQLQRLEKLIEERAAQLPASFGTIDPNVNSESDGSADGSLAANGQTAEPGDQDNGSEFFYPALPDQAPDIDEILASKSGTDENSEMGEFSAFVPHAAKRQQLSLDELFNPTRDQHTGLILGFAIANRKYIEESTGETKEVFMVRPGDDVQITLPTAGAMNAVTENFTVVDFYNSSMHEYDSSFAFMPLKRLQEIRQMIDPVTGAASVNTIQIKLKDGANLSEVRDKLLARYPVSYYPFVVQTWQDQQRPLLSAVNLELTILNILLFLIIAVAGFGILATFFMIVVEKTKDIGVLKALGAPSHGVMSIFLSYGVSLGVVGTGVGIGIGLLFVYRINDIANLVQWVTGQEIFDPTIYYFSEIPTIVNPWMIVMVAFGAIGIAVLAAVLPALRAARLHPVEALRYE